MIIFLCGMPGSGKTTIGKELAKSLNTNLIDLDEFITRKEKLTIPKIFKTKGEDYFRKAETACLKELIEKNKTAVVSVGGGTPCYNNNMQVMLQGGKVFYLKTNIETLATRIEADDSIRPLFHKLNGKKLVEKITSMLAHREKFYLKAGHTVTTENKSPAEIAKEISDSL